MGYVFSTYLVIWINVAGICKKSVFFVCLLSKKELSLCSKSAHTVLGNPKEGIYGTYVLQHTNLKQ